MVAFIVVLTIRLVAVGGRHGRRHHRAGGECARPVPPAGVQGTSTLHTELAPGKPGRSQRR
eukprot:1182671-Prorocentrum_minimum.AAC.1